MGCLESREEQKVLENDPTMAPQIKAATGEQATPRNSQGANTPASGRSPRSSRKSQQQWVPKSGSLSGGATGETANVSHSNSDKDEFAASGATGDAKGEASPAKLETLNQSQDSGISSQDAKPTGDEKQVDGLSSPREGGSKGKNKNKKKNQNQNQNQSQNQTAQQQQAAGGQSGRNNRKKNPTGA